MQGPIYITGGTGLVGSHVAERLAARGAAVVALVRERSDTAFLESIGARLVTGDVTAPPEALASGMRDCAAVVHAAAVVYRRGTRRREYARVNVEGTRNVIDAARRAGVARLVHVSSIAVYGSAPATARLGEEHWRYYPTSWRAAYPWSKREAERLVWRAHEERRVRATTLRPGVTFGERDRLFTRYLIRAASLPVVPLPGGGSAVPPFVYAGNVAIGVVAALEREAAAGHAYNLASDHDRTLREILEQFARALGRTPRFMPIPGALLRAPAAALDAILAAAPGVAAGPQLSRAARTLLRPHPYAQQRARATLDWRAEALVPLAEAVARTVAWWRQSRPDAQDRTSREGRDRKQ